MPPGAEEISLELNGIWENISHDDEEYNKTSKPIQDDDNNELRPLSWRFLLVLSVRPRWKLKNWFLILNIVPV